MLQQYFHITLENKTKAHGYFRWASPLNEKISLVLVGMQKLRYSLSQDQYQRNHICWVRHIKIYLCYETMLELREMIYPKMLTDHGELCLGGKIANSEQA